MSTLRTPEQIFADIRALNWDHPSFTQLIATVQSKADCMCGMCDGMEDVCAHLTDAYGAMDDVFMAQPSAERRAA